MIEVRENDKIEVTPTEEEFVVDEEKATESLLYIRTICKNNKINGCRNCIFGNVRSDRCSIIDGGFPSTWDLMCDGNNGKIFR